MTDAARLDAVVGVAQEVFHGEWSRDPSLRAGALLEWADALEARAAELGDLLMRESGKIRAETEDEMRRSVDALRYNPGIARIVEGQAATMPDGSAAHVPAGRRVRLHRPLELARLPAGPSRHRALTSRLDRRFRFICRR